MKVWEHTLAELTDSATPNGDIVVEFYDGYQFDARTISAIPDSQYATAMATPASGTLADQLLLSQSGNDWVIVGFYVDDTIQLRDQARRTGMAEELLLRCAEHRSVPLSKKFTLSGFKLVKRAHKLAVQRALKADLPVPEAVRAEYPEVIEATAQSN